MAASHCTVRQNIHAHRYGTPVANQGIENFWSHLRHIFTSLLVNFFKQMFDKGLLELGNHFHTLNVLRDNFWFSRAVCKSRLQMLSNL